MQGRKILVWERRHITDHINANWLSVRMWMGTLREHDLRAER